MRWSNKWAPAYYCIKIYTYLLLLFLLVVLLVALVVLLVTSVSSLSLGLEVTVGGTVVLVSLLSVLGVLLVVDLAVLAGQCVLSFLQ